MSDPVVPNSIPPNTATKKMTFEPSSSDSDREFRAYTAGFFDADGSVGVYWRKHEDLKRYKRGGYFLLGAKIDQKLWMPIFQEWRERWGGSLVHGRTKWHWQTSGQNTAQFLRDILPWLRKKKEQAELAVKFQESRRRGIRPTDAEFEWQKAVSEALKEMKRTGEPAPIQFLKQVKESITELCHQLELFSLEGIQEEDNLEGKQKI